MQRQVDDAVPLHGLHAGEHRVVVDACVVDDDLHRAGLQHLRHGGGGGAVVAQVEGAGFSVATGGLDLVGQCSQCVGPAMAMQQHRGAIECQAARDG